MGLWGREDPEEAAMQRSPSSTFFPCARPTSPPNTPSPTRLWAWSSVSFQRFPRSRDTSRLEALLSRSKSEIESVSLGSLRGLIPSPAGTNQGPKRHRSRVPGEMQRRPGPARQNPEPPMYLGEVPTGRCCPRALPQDHDSAGRGFRLAWGS